MSDTMPATFKDVTATKEESIKSFEEFIKATTAEV